MAHICPYCSNETGGADPCPWCGGSLGVVPNARITPAVIHERYPWDWRPIAVVCAMVALVALVIVKRPSASNNSLVLPDQIASRSQRLVASRDPGVSLTNVTPSQTETGEVGPVITEMQPSKTVSSEDNPEADQDLADEPTFDQMADTVPPDDADQPNLPQSDVPFNDLVGIADAQVSIQSDGAGHGMAFGAVTIVNNGPYPIDSFQVTMQTQDGSYALTPFSGSFDNPTELTDRVIPVGGYLQVPVMSNGMFDITDPSAPYNVTVTANEGGAVISNSYPVSG